VENVFCENEFGWFTSKCEFSSRDSGWCTEEQKMCYVLSENLWSIIVMDYLMVACAKWNWYTIFAYENYGAFSLLIINEAFEYDWWSILLSDINGVFVWTTIPLFEILFKHLLKLILRSC
jgi:hypothetical protein